MIVLAMTIAVLAGAVLGLSVGWASTSMRIYRLESKFRALANEVSEQTAWDRTDTLPASWVQDRLDTFINEEFVR